MEAKKMSLSCEQLYEIWSSEPELLVVLDSREKDLFNCGHIPGAIHVIANEIKSRLDKIGEKLAVIICSDIEKEFLLSDLHIFNNYMFLHECKRWESLQLPIVEKSIDDINNNLVNKGFKMNDNSIFFQLFEPESSTYTYIIGDSQTKEAAIIDPVIETVDRDLKFIGELGLKILYILDTHVHADHITAAGEIKKMTGAKTAVSSLSKVECVDLLLDDGQELKLGNKTIKAITTPGHTNSCMSFYFEGKVFTGDALLIRGSGRTDFQQGSSEILYNSVHNKLYRLPDETVVYPAHDYRGFTSSTIALEKKFNPRLGIDKSLEDFKKIMSELKLPYPKKIDVSLPANLKCGFQKESRVLHPQTVDGIPEVSNEDVFKHKTKIKLIDVRRPEEFNGEYGHIEGAILITQGEELTNWLATNDKNQEIAFICRSGGRSGNATLESQHFGFTKTVNMTGGMIMWNEKKLPIVR